MVPLDPVTVSVYVVVAAGETLTATPLVMLMLPGVMTPEPPAKTAVRVALEPASISAGLAVKLVIFGETVTVVVEVAGEPVEPVTVSV